MKPRRASLVLILVLSALACGESRVERGLAVPDEESTPESAGEMKKTDQQRQAEVLQEEQQMEIQEFDAAEMSPDAAPARP